MANLVKKIRTDAGDLQIDYNALANLPALNTMFSNPNLLINSNFRNPVNQRGQTSYTGGSIYAIDRWMLGNNATLTVQSGSIKFEQSSGATNTGRLVYKFEHALPANYYTISIKVLSCNGGVSMDNFGAIADGFTGIFTATTTSKVELSTLRFYIAAGRNIELEWIKLEQGSISTPFVPRLYGEELALCQRYYQKYSSYMLFPQFYENQYHGFYFRVPLRVSPYVANFVASSTDGTSISVGESAGGHIEVDANCVRRLFAGNSYKGSAIQLELLELDAEIY